MKQAKAVSASKDGAGPPLPRASIERVPKVRPRRFHSLPADLEALWTHQGLLRVAVDEERREVSSSSG